MFSSVVNKHTYVLKKCYKNQTIFTYSVSKMADNMKVSTILTVWSSFDKEKDHTLGEYLRRMTVTLFGLTLLKYTKNLNCIIILIFSTWNKLNTSDCLWYRKQD